MTTAEVVPFRFVDANAEIRTSEQDGQLWFNLSDVCGVLEHTNPTRAAGRLDTDEVTRLRVRTGGGAQEMLMISESGMYSLVLSSRSAGAKRFKSWITREVIPAIRRDGFYATFEWRENLANATAMLNGGMVNAAETARSAGGRGLVAANLIDKMRKDLVEDYLISGILGGQEAYTALL